jgi:hypothetical protein
VEIATTAADGKTYRVEYFNLDVIISVGYRVKSRRGTQFRVWATQRLRNYQCAGARQGLSQAPSSRNKAILDFNGHGERPRDNHR